METIRQNGKIILHTAQYGRDKHQDDFQQPYGQEFQREGICRLYPVHCYR